MNPTSTANVYKSCINFTAATGNSFKIDPSGAWGDGIPAKNNYGVNKGWVKILFNSTSKTITTEQNLGADCVASIHLRGTQTATAWAEGDLFTPVAGSASSYEICRNFVTGDADGGPRFKIDPNGAWGADSFPAMDVTTKGWTKIVIDSIAKTIVSTTSNLEANCGGTSTSSATSSSAASVSSKSSNSTSSTANSSVGTTDDFRARTTYFMFVDRFANGDTTNDAGKNAVATVTPDAADPTHLKAPISQWKKYWGGDIQGIINKLDYLQALGITAIWVTPLVDNVDLGTEGIYHGYQSHDFYEVDEHLGDWALVDELNVQMEQRGMKLVLDIALNHSNHYKDAEKGLLMKEGKKITDFLEGKGTWYHDAGTILDCGVPCKDDWDVPTAYRNKMLFDLADFNHGINSNSPADEYLIGAALKWMDHGVDAFRIDAIKHMEPSFVNRFTAAVRAKKADTYIFGEWYDAGANNADSMRFLGENRGSELLDFNLRDAIEGVIAGTRSTVELSNHIKARPAAMKNKENLQPIFLDNHDATRTSVFLQATGKVSNGRAGRSFPKVFADARQNLGMALVMTLPGVPVVYYGTEQNTAVFNMPPDNLEQGSDPYNREMMPSFSQTTPAFKLISALAELRKTSTAIQRGSYAERWVDNEGDLLVFQRQDGADCSVVAINRGAEKTVTVPNLCLANAAYTNKVGADVVNVSSGSGTFTLSQNEVIVLH